MSEHTHRGTQACPRHRQLVHTWYYNSFVFIPQSVLSKRYTINTLPLFAPVTITTRLDMSRSQGGTRGGHASPKARSMARNGLAHIVHTIATGSTVTENMANKCDIFPRFPIPVWYASAPWYAYEYGQRTRRAGPRPPDPQAPRPHAIKEPKTELFLLLQLEKNPGARREKATLSIRAQVRLRQPLSHGKCCACGAI